MPHTLLFPWPPLLTPRQGSQRPGTCSLLPSARLTPSPLLVFLLPARHRSLSDISGRYPTARDSLTPQRWTSRLGKQEQLRTLRTTGGGPGPAGDHAHAELRADLVLPVADFQVHLDAWRVPRACRVWVAKGRGAPPEPGGVQADGRPGAAEGDAAVSAGCRTRGGRLGQFGGPFHSAPSGVAGLPELMGAAWRARATAASCPPVGHHASLGPCRLVLTSG